tara:strand:+ start:381 stop:515 length:135 start_codon:yes stop_codon:yes gene_type:complete
MTVAELLSKISSREITEWAAYYTLENEDQEAADRKAKMRSKMGN